MLATPRVLRRLCSLLHLAMLETWLARPPPGRRFNEEASSGSWVWERQYSASRPVFHHLESWTRFPDLDMEFDAFATHAAPVSTLPPVSPAGDHVSRDNPQLAPTGRGTPWHPHH